MKKLKYKQFLENKGLKYKSSYSTFTGDVEWGISLDRHNMAIVHDCYGKAYKGLRLNDMDIINYDDFYPAYGNTPLKPLPMPKGSIKIRRIVFKQGDLNVWGVGELAGNRFLVCDRYRRLFSGPDIKEGDTVRKEKFSPAYQGKALVPCPSLNVFSDIPGID